MGGWIGWMRKRERCMCLSCCCSGKPHAPHPAVLPINNALHGASVRRRAATGRLGRLWRGSSMYAEATEAGLSRAKDHHGCMARRRRPGTGSDVHRIGPGTWPAIAIVVIVPCWRISKGFKGGRARCPGLLSVCFGFVELAEASTSDERKQRALIRASVRCCLLWSIALALSLCVQQQRLLSSIVEEGTELDVVTGGLPLAATGCLCLVSVVLSARFPLSVAGNSTFQAVHSLKRASAGHPWSQNPKAAPAPQRG